jgi:hypothetical protein
MPVSDTLSLCDLRVLADQAGIARDDAGTLGGVYSHKPG